MILINEFRVSETSTFIEQIIEGLEIKLVSDLQTIIFLQLSLDDKGHVAKRQG